MDFSAISDSQPPRYIGSHSVVTRCQDSDGRLHVTVATLSTVDPETGTVQELPYSTDYIDALGEFVFAESLGRSPPKGIINVARNAKDIAIRRSSAMGNPKFGAYLDGCFLDNDGNGHSVLDLAEQGKLSRNLHKEVVGGVDCSAVTSATSIGTLQIWVSPSKGNNIIAFNLIGPVRSGLHPFQYIETFRATAFRTIGARVVVSNGEWTSTWQNSRGTILKYSGKAGRDTFDFSPNFTVSDPFTFRDVPNGLQVVFDDLDFNPVRFVWKDGKALPDVDSDAIGKIATAVSSAGATPIATDSGSAEPIDDTDHRALFVGVAVAAAGAILFAVVLFTRARGKIE